MNAVLEVASPESLMRSGVAQSRRKHKVVLYNPADIFFTMPLALVAVASHLDPRIYDVRIIDGRLESNPIDAIAPHLDEAICFGVTVMTGAPIKDAIHICRAVKERRPESKPLKLNSHLRKRLNVSPSQMSRGIKALEKAGLLRRLEMTPGKLQVVVLINVWLIRQRVENEK